MSVMLLAGCQSAADDSADPTNANLPLPTRAELTEGWNQLAPLGATSCATNTPFSFFVHSAESDNLLLYFEGGGGCWDSVTCDPNNPGLTYTPFVDENDEPNAAGIFDFNNPQNPFADYNVVYVPYCTGDVHLGDAIQSYSLYNDNLLIVQHNGFNNSMSAIDWMVENYDAPATVFVTGSSAGAIPSPFYAAIIAEQYPDTRIEQLGDAGGAYRSKIGERLYPIWGANDVLAQLPRADEVADVMVGQTFEEIYIAAAQLHPNITFSQFNTAEDSVQAQFLRIIGAETIGDETTLGAKIQANYADIASNDADNFVSYMGSGGSHVILDNNSFYNVSADGVPFYQWVGAIAADEEVESVRCNDCTR